MFAIDERYRGRSSRTYWIYDYQLIGQDGKITEKRVLLEKNGEKLHQEKAQLETMFHSYYSFYMPVTILAGEKQHLYQYRLMDKKKIKKKLVWHIAAVRRDQSLSIPWGEIWVSEADGAVLKIQLDQTSIIGFEKLAQQAIEKGLMPEISIIHEYELEKNGINFPSKTIFIEKYRRNAEPKKKSNYSLGFFFQQNNVSMDNGRNSFERSRTYFEYKDHRFFSVSTSVKEKTE